MRTHQSMELHRPDAKLLWSAMQLQTSRFIKFGDVTFRILTVRHSLVTISPQSSTVKSFRPLLHNPDTVLSISVVAEDAKVRQKYQKYRFALLCSVVLRENDLRSTPDCWSNLSCFLVFPAENRKNSQAAL